MRNMVIVGLRELQTLLGARSSFMEHFFQALMIVDFYGMAP